MRNLKRALSLALALVMVLSMMVVGASAVSADDFTDAEEIVNKEAVTTLAALNIILGNDDGSYAPTDTISRAEMSTIICRVLNGGQDPVLGDTVTTSYTDTANHWARAYIEYCTQLGIVSGRGDGTFDPEGDVTASEAAKMILVAMGYDANHEGMVGANWSVATNVLANLKGLYTDLILQVDAPVTRDNAAQMLYNAINAKMVVYTYALVTGPDGTLTSIPRVEDTSYTMLNNRFGAVRVEGVVEENEFSNNAVAMDGKTRITVTNSDELRVTLPEASNSSSTSFSGNTFNFVTGKEEFGQKVILYVRPATNSVAASQATVLTDPILSDDNVVATTTTSFGTDKTLNDFADDNGLEFTVDSSDNVEADFYTNYGAAAAALTAQDGTTHLPTYTNTVGTEIILIDNDSDGVVEKVLQNQYAFGQVTRYDERDEGSVTVRATGSNLVPSSEELDNIVAYDGIAVDDYVNVTLVDDTYYITAAEVVEGVLDSYEKDNNETTTLTVDGTDYTTSQNNSYAGTEDLVNARDGANTSPNSPGSEGVFYLDAFGYIVAMRLGAADAFAYVATTGWSDNVASGYNPGTLTVYAVLEDGSAATYTVTEVYDTNGSTEISINGNNYRAEVPEETIYKYALDGEGGIKLTKIAVGAQYNPGADELDSGSGEYNFRSGESTVYYDKANDRRVSTTDNTVFFYVFLDDNGDVDTVDVYTGFENAPSIVTDSGDSLDYMYVMDSRDENAAAVLVKTEAVTSVNYMYVIEYLRTTARGDVYRVWMDGELQEITTNGAERVRYEGAYTYTMSASGLYNIKTTNLVETGYARSIQGNSLVLESGNEYNIANAEVVLIDGDKTAASGISRYDTVVVVYDQGASADTAKNVFIVAEYDETETTAALRTNQDQVVLANTVDFDYKIKYQTELSSAAAILGNFAMPYSASHAYIATSDPGTAVAAATESGKITTLNATSGTLEDGTGSGPIYYLVVVSEDGKHYEATKIRFLTGAEAPSAVTVESNSTDASGYPVLSFTGGTVTDGGTLSYQWYKVGTPDEAVEGATGATFVPTEAGDYYVVVTNTNASATGNTTAETESDPYTVNALAEADAPTALTVTAATGSPSVTDGNLLTQTPTIDALLNDGITISYTATPDQTVDITINGRAVVTNAQGTGAPATSSEYFLGASVMGTNLEIVVTVNQAGRTPWTETYQVAVTQTVATPTALTLTGAQGTGATDAPTINNSGNLLTFGTTEITVTSAEAGNTISVTSTPATGSTVTYTITGAGTATEDSAYTLVAGDLDSSITVTVTASGGGYAEYSETFTISVSST